MTFPGSTGGAERGAGASNAKTAALIEHYNELLVQRHAASTQRMLMAALEDTDMKLHGHPVGRLLRPCFLSAETYERVQRAAALVASAIKTLSLRMASDRSLWPRLHLPPMLLQALDLAVGEPESFLSRFDGYLTEDGSVRFLEYNTGPGGLIHGDKLVACFGAMPVLDELRRRYPFRPVLHSAHFVEATLQGYRRRGGSGRPNIAVIRSPDPTAAPPAPSAQSVREVDLSHYAVQYPGIAETISLFQLLIAAGLDLRVVQSNELEHAGGHLKVGDFRIDIAVVMGWEEILAGGPNHPLHAAIRERSTWVVNSLAADLLRGKKGTFALLSDPDVMRTFPADVAAALAEHIPWTRVVAESRTTRGGDVIDLIPHVLARRDDLVLKPVDSYGGKGVVLGWECDAATWQAAAERALGGHYVVQERVRARRDRYPIMIDGQVEFAEHTCDLNPFVWNDAEPYGCFARASSTGLSNISSGGAVTPVFLID